jgi:hypothetical protein
MKMHPKSILAGPVLAVVLWLAFVQGAGAHVYWYSSGDPANKPSDWYFYGSTFQRKPCLAFEGCYQHTVRKDPVNWIFFGTTTDLHQSECASYSLDCIQTHVENDWAAGSMHGAGLCKSTQYLAFRRQGGTGGGAVWDANDRQLLTGRRIPTPRCSRQFHTRLWDDKEHAEITTHGSRNQWVIGGIHHEKPGPLVGHVPDRDWDAVRVQAVRAMRAHCSAVHWRIHPGAGLPTRQRNYQAFDNSGYIARISLRHNQPNVTDCPGS